MASQSIPSYADPVPSGMPKAQERVALPEVLRHLLAAPGQMALTLYTLQVLILHTYVVLSGGARDDHWWLLALLIGSSVGFAWLWQGLGAASGLDRHLPPSMRRGPLEGVMDLVARLLVR